MIVKGDADRITGVPFIFLLIFVSILFLFGLNKRHLWSADEPRVAGIGAEMALTGDMVVPRLNGKPFLEKPPLYFWIASATFHIFGVNTYSARIPSAVAAIGSILFIYFLAKRMGFSSLAVFLSVLILATSVEFWTIGRRCIVDMMLCLFVTGTMFFYYQAVCVSRRRILWSIGFVIFLACSILTKGLVGLAIPCSAIFFWLLLKRNFKLQPWLLLVLGSIASFIPVGIWVWFLCKSMGNEEVYRVIVTNNIGRFTGQFPQHVGPFYYYFINFPLQFFPWILFVPLVIVSQVKQIRQKKLEDSSFFALTWFLVPFILLSIAAGKRGIYLVPLYPAAALVAGQALGEFLEESKLHENIFKIPAGIFAWIVFLTPIGFLGASIYFKQSFWTWPLVSIPGICAGLYVLRNFPKKEYIRFFRILAVALLILYVTFDVAIAPINNKKNSFEPLFDYCRGLQSDGAKIGLVAPKERLSGAAVFYLGYRIPSFWSSESNEIHEFLDSKNEAYIIDFENIVKDLKDVEILKTFKISHDIVVVARQKKSVGQV